MLFLCHKIESLWVLYFFNGFGFRTEHENLHIYLKLSCRLTWFKWKS